MKQKFRPFRLMNRVLQAVRSGHEVAVFDISNTWAYDGGKYERGRIKDTDIRVQRERGDEVWEVMSK